MGLPLGAQIMAPLVIDEKLNKSQIYEVKAFFPLDMSADPRLWKGSDVQLVFGMVPNSTKRKCVIEGRKKLLKRGKVGWDFTLKCKSARMQRVRQDRVWENMSPYLIAQRVALEYGLVLVSDAVTNVATFATLHQLGTDWELIKKIGERLDCDVSVVGNFLYLKDRPRSLLKPSVRTYLWPDQPFDITVEEVADGRTHAKGANREQLSYDEALGVLAADRKQNDPGLGSHSEFNENDPVGVVKGTVTPGLPVPEAAISTWTGHAPGTIWTAKMGQYDSGKGTPDFDWNTVYTNAKAKAMRRRYRDKVKKIRLNYDEWDARGTPMIGTKIMIVGTDRITAGAYYVIGRRITKIPKTKVELLCSRTSVTTARGGLRAKKETLAALLRSPAVQAKLALIEKETQDPNSVVPKAPTMTQDFGG